MRTIPRQVLDVALNGFEGHHVPAAAVGSGSVPWTEGRPLTEDSEVSDPTTEKGSTSGDAAAWLYVLLSGLWLAAGVLVGALAALQLIYPELLGGISFLAYGRAQSIFLDAILYGWLSMAGTGAMIYIVPRLCGTPLVGGAFLKVNAYLWFVATLVGVGTVGAGLGAGQPFLEFPIYVAGALLVSSLITAFSVIATIVRRTEAQLFPSLWYFGLAVIALPIMIVAANVPIYAGIGQSVQANFYAQNIMGLWLLAAATGAAYYFVPKIAGAPLYSRRLASVGFWSLLIFWIFTGQIRGIFGPSQDGLQSMAIAFAIVSAIPIWSTLSNLTRSLKGKWSALGRSAPIRFFVAGGGLLFLYSLTSPLGALRSSQQIVGLTDFLLGNTELLLLGALSCWAAGSAYEVIPRVSGRQWVSTGLANWHLGLGVLGVVTLATGAWIGGAVTGFIWEAGATSAKPVTTGEAWRAVAEPMRWFATMRSVGMALVAIGAVIFLFNLIRTTMGGELGAREALVPREPEGNGQKRENALAILISTTSIIGIGLWLAVSLPVANDSFVTPTQLGSDRQIAAPNLDTPEARGRLVYAREGCWNCHSQLVRPIRADSYLGPVSVAGDYAYDDPQFLGARRVGPDLTHFAGRDGTKDPNALAAHLENPREAVKWSVMPSYSHLSDEQMQDLVSYLSTLK